MLEGRTPLGWLQLAHSRSRLVVASAGVGFAVVLVFMQLGFMNMLFDTTVQLHKTLVADLVITSTEATGIPDTGTFSRRRLVQAAGVPGVAGATEVYMATLGWTRPTDGETGQILVIGVPTTAPVFLDPALDARLPSLRLAGSLLLDEGARGDYAAFFDGVAAGDRPEVEVAGITLTTVGSCSFGATFAIEAIAITSAETFLALVPSRAPGVLNLGLVSLAPGADPARVARQVQDAVGPEVIARPMSDFIALSRARLATDSPIATVFSFGAVVGFAVGAIIVVQILSSDVQDHLSEYATFKAMGFTNRYLLGVVYEQSAILTLAGFVPAYGMALLLYALVGSLVDMTMTMTLSRVLWVFLLTVVMCAVAGTIALRRLAAADPADVF